MTRQAVCIIGAGCSGFTTAKRLADAGIAFDCFEASDNIGGNWYYNNPNGMSACYQTLHIDTSKWRLAFEDFPVPANWPDFPHHSQLLQYFNDYVDHFDLRRRITFNTRVLRADQAADGSWQIRLSSGEVRRYRALIVANGHHWDPNLPQYPGLFTGAALHAHAYRDPFTPVAMHGKRVLVVGMGNSAMDIASELSQRSVASRCLVSARRGVWVFPKYLDGKPADKSPPPPWLPRAIALPLVRRMLKSRIGSMRQYGLPEPDHEPLQAHPSVSEEFLYRAGCGDVTMKPGIASLDGDGVIFTDGSREAVDVIIWATGYKISFPFFDDPALLPDAQNRFPLFKRLVIPGNDTLFFMGLAQALPTLVNLAEQQSKLVAAWLAGSYAPPPVEQMRRITQADEAFYLRGYYTAQRHTIQLDFAHYVRDLAREARLGAARAARAAARAA